MARLRSIETARTDLPAIRHFVTLEVSDAEVKKLKLGERYALVGPPVSFSAEYHRELDRFLHRILGLPSD